MAFSIGTMMAEFHKYVIHLKCSQSIITVHWNLNLFIASGLWGVVNRTGTLACGGWDCYLWPGGWLYTQVTAYSGLVYCTV